MYFAETADQEHAVMDPGFYKMSVIFLIVVNVLLMDICQEIVCVGLARKRMFDGNWQECEGEM